MNFVNPQRTWYSTREVLEAFIVRRKRTQMRPDDLSNPGEFRPKNSKIACSEYT